MKYCNVLYKFIQIKNWVKQQLYGKNELNTRMVFQNKESSDYVCRLGPVGIVVVEYTVKII